MNMKLRNVPFIPPDMTEAEANEVRDAILSGWITTGPRTKKLEKLLAGYVGVEDGGSTSSAGSPTSSPAAHPNCVCLNSQTTAREKKMVGAMTWNLPFGDSPVERQQVYYGSPLPVIEGETWNQFIYRIAQLFSLHGQNKDALAKTKLGAWEYDIIGPWYKCNMTDVVADIGLIQYERYPGMLARRQEMIERMDKAFDDLNADLAADHKSVRVAYLNHYCSEYSGSGHLYLVRLLGRSREDANHVIEQMAERGIACNVHYKPLPMMTAYRALGYDIASFPNAYHMFENEITLPLNTKMTDEDVEYASRT